MGGRVLEQLDEGRDVVGEMEARAIVPKGFGACHKVEVRLACGEEVPVASQEDGVAVPEGGSARAMRRNRSRRAPIGRVGKMWMFMTVSAPLGKNKER